MKTGDQECATFRSRRILARSLRIAGYLLFVYVTTYFLLMEPEFPAVDPAIWTATYESGYWFAETNSLPWLHKAHLPAPCWINRVFWPMDCVVQPWLKPCDKAVRGWYGW
jgi:hypothetical protein